MISNSLILDKKKLKNDLKKYKSCKNNKISVASIILFVIFLALLIVGMILTFKVETYYIILVICSFICAIASAFFYRRVDNLNKITFIKNLELANHKYAEDNNVLNLHPVFPLYFKACDEDNSLTIYYMNDTIIACNYSDIKNYKIYYNSDHETKQRLPKNPIKGVKKYSIEILFGNGEKSTIELINYFGIFMLNSKVDYLQFVNTKSINDLATILDEVLRANKKNK